MYYPGTATTGDHHTPVSCDILWHTQDLDIRRKIQLQLPACCVSISRASSGVVLFIALTLLCSVEQHSNVTAVDKTMPLETLDAQKGADNLQHTQSPCTVLASGHKR